MPDRRSRPKAGLTREKVLDTALVFIDEHGLPALSMRKLGAELGVEAMTLYHYVPNKDTLLDGLVERVLVAAWTEAGGEESALLAWPEWLRAWAIAMRAALLRHPGTLTLVGTRPANSPEMLRIMENALAVLRAAGLSLGRALDVLNAVNTFVVGHTLAEAGQTPGHEGTEPDLDQHAADLTPAEFPNLAEVITTRAGLDFDSRFLLTLDILLAGFAALG